MNQQTFGHRPRPRVAALGTFAQETAEHIKRIFPTVYEAQTIVKMKEQVDVREVDLLLISPTVKNVADWPDEVNVISFSPYLESLPGPFGDFFVYISSAAETEAYTLPPTLLPFDRQRKQDLSRVEGIRGWPILDISFPHYPNRPYPNEEDTARSKHEFVSGGILFESITGNVLATHYVRDSGRGVAWFPPFAFDQKNWISLIVQHWANQGVEAFLGYRDWTVAEEWLAVQEREIRKDLLEIEQRKQEAIENFDLQLAKRSQDYVEASIQANENERKLLTTQDSELVSIVSKTLSLLGFIVEDMDEKTEDGKPKLEDLRLSHPDNPEWRAIVEVRGYAKSSGKTGDFQRIARFAELFQQEFRRSPDKKLYIVNGPIEVPPPNRDAPFSASEEDLAEFAKGKGLVIWTNELYRAVYTRNADPDTLRKSIIESVGLWESD